MGNPLFNHFGNQNNNFVQLINQIQEFKRTFTGNPKQEVERLLQTGQMSQSQFNELSRMANQILPFLPK